MFRRKGMVKTKETYSSDSYSKEKKWKREPSQILLKYVPVRQINMLKILSAF